MALLRKNIRMLARSARLFGTETQTATLDIKKLMKGGGRAIPTLVLKDANFAINEWLRNNEDISSERWIHTRKELLSSREFRMNESTVDMAIVNLCLACYKLELAMSYLIYLWNSEHDMNISSMMTYLKLCSLKKTALTASELEYITKIFDKIKEQYPILPPSVGECCIQGISMTDRWKEASDLLESLKLNTKPYTASYTPIIKAAFKHDEPNLGWKYLNEMITKGNPDHFTYITYLDYCTRNFNGEELENEIGKIFDFWGASDIRPYIDVIAAYQKVLDKLGWTSTEATITKSGKCLSCGHNLANLQVTEDEFAKLANTVHERVLVGKDVWQNSTPVEMTAFLQFVERTRPYDVVIDGLNVSYVATRHHKPNGLELTNIFKMCLKEGKKILVLGRQHMLSWPKMDYKFMKNNGHVFLAKDLSEDDPYLLYATLRSGSHTQVISKDLMRQHKCLLGDQELMKTFKYWLMAHKVIPATHVTSQGIQTYLKYPPTYLPLAQRNDNGFHAPYIHIATLQPPTIYEPPKSWVCFRKHGSPVKRKFKVSEEVR